MFVTLVPSITLTNETGAMLIPISVKVSCAGGLATPGNAAAT